MSASPPSRRATAALTSSGSEPSARTTGVPTRPVTSYPAAIETFPGHKRNDIVLWIEGHRAVIAGTRSSTSDWDSS